MNMIPVLFEARFDVLWHSMRVTREFSSVKAAMDSLLMFAQQQKVSLEDVRVKALRTAEQVVAAEQAVAQFWVTGK